LIDVRQSAIIIGFKKDNNREHLTRLISFGFVPGFRITLLGKALLGDPIRVSILGSIVMLRKKEFNMLILKGEME